MLLELSIKDYILIEEATISFGSKLNVLTGETGAGKSMLVGAIGLLLGRKASASEIRSGTDKAFITAVFDADVETYSEYGIPSDDVLILTRELHRNGRSVARANGMPITVQILKKISQSLINIHGQNDQLELLNKEYQLAMLDEFSGHGLESKMEDAYNALRNAQKELELLTQDETDRTVQLDYLKFQLDEINAVNLQSGEDEELEKEYQYLMSIEKIGEAVSAAKAWLEDGEYSAISGIHDVTRSLKSVSELSDEIDGLYQYAEQTEALLSEFSSEVSRYIDGLSIDQSRVYEVENRLDKINTLKRKFGNTIEDIVREGDALAEKIDKLEHIEETIDEAKARLKKAEEEYEIISVELRKNRVLAAEKLAKAIEEELHHLNMKEAALEIQVIPAKPSKTGSDDVDIKISTAVGHELRSLKKVVSGGELSRIMLAIKLLTQRGVTMLFDEIDAGISGITAGVVGEKLSALATANQLLCITHLPQIAVFADTHMVIEKTSDDEKTVTEVNQLDENGRKEEIARLVGGTKKSSATYTHSEEMLRMAEEYKQSRRSL